MANSLKRYQSRLASFLSRTSPSYYTGLGRSNKGSCINYAEAGRSSFGQWWEGVADALKALFQGGNPLSQLSWIMMKLMHRAGLWGGEQTQLYVTQPSHMFTAHSRTFISLCFQLCAVENVCLLSWCKEGNCSSPSSVTTAFFHFYVAVHLGHFCHGSLYLHLG